MTNGTTLLVATPGGHVDELLDLEERFTLAGTQPRWVTASSTQTRTLLQDRLVHWVPRVGSRQWMRALRSTPRAFLLLRRLRPKRLVSSGAALTLPYMVAARSVGAEVVYVESATRLRGPSLTGRMAERIPGLTLYRQADWQRRRWQPTPGVFDHYAMSVLPEQGTRAVERVLLTVGSERFTFTRALQAVAGALPEGVRLSAQTGVTDVPEAFQGDARPWWPYGELKSATLEADVVVTHAGVGALLLALRTGHCPVVIPRLAEHGEHIDDHQLDLARSLAERGLVVLAEPSDDLWAKVQEAGARRVVRNPLVAT